MSEAEESAIEEETEAEESVDGVNEPPPPKKKKAEESSAFMLLSGVRLMDGLPEKNSFR